MSLNRVVIMGRLTRDPELRRTQTGTAVTSFSLAVDRDFKSRESGEKRKQGPSRRCSCEPQAPQGLPVLR